MSLVTRDHRRVGALPGHILTPSPFGCPTFLGRPCPIQPSHRASKSPRTPCVTRHRRPIGQLLPGSCLLGHRSPSAFGCPVLALEISKTVLLAPPCLVHSGLAPPALQATVEGDDEHGAIFCHARLRSRLLPFSCAAGLSPGLRFSPS